MSEKIEFFNLSDTDLMDCQRKYNIPQIKYFLHHRKLNHYLTRIITKKLMDHPEVNLELESPPAIEKYKKYVLYFQ